ncbi:MAG: pyridoxal phosphate-dependent aminotransferase [Gammaproteobacteria bacterium]|nr:pyridoxal phosphate-dependent aminotransferase [Gammaproteobacteria bacterium]
MKLATRMSRLGTETAFEVFSRARELESRGKSIVHFELGEPDFDTPAEIIEAANRALADGYTHYTPAAGLPEVREAVAEHVARTRGIPVGPEEVVVTPGAKPIIFFPMLALLQPGDEVIYPDPGFPIYESMIRFTGATPVPVPLRAERKFSFDADELLGKVSGRTRMVVLNSPQNPTGGVAPADDLERLARGLRDTDAIVLSDEVYSEILYEGEHVSISRFPGMRARTIILDGWSKTYAMTGWRLGFGVMPVGLADQVAKLQVNSNSCAPAFCQVAGAAALRMDRGPVHAMVREFRRRRDTIVDGLNAVPGFECLRPKGAFYAFPSIAGTGRNAAGLQRELLEEAGVAALAGTAFGENGEGFLRFSYATSVGNIEEGLARIRRHLRAGA